MYPFSSPPSSLSGAAVVLTNISRLFGWIYFFAWSISFYPQPLLNWRRRSTVGVLIDFPLANVLGFLFYTISTCMMFFSPTVREEYARRNPKAPEPTVRSNDVAFAVHALVICLVTFSQFSEKVWGLKQGSRKPTKGLLGLSLGCIAAVLWATWMALAQKGWAWLDVIYAFGYAKLAITIAKYVPQAIANQRRRSTVGWSIGQVLLDFFGGILSIAQLLIDSHLQGDWSGVTGNPVKFGLGNVSLLFDLVFMTQHYILFPPRLQGTVGERESLLERSDDEARLD